MLQIKIKTINTVEHPDRDATSGQICSMCTSVFFNPIDWWDHPENYSFYYYKLKFTVSKYPKNIQFDFGNKITGAYVRCGKGRGMSWADWSDELNRSLFVFSTQITIYWIKVSQIKRTSGFENKCVLAAWERQRHRAPETSGHQSERSSDRGNVRTELSAVRAMVQDLHAMRSLVQSGGATSSVRGLCLLNGKYGFGTT